MQHPLCRLQLAVFLSFQLEFAFFFLGGKTSAIFKTEDNAVIVRSFVPMSQRFEPEMGFGILTFILAFWPSANSKRKCE